jgi:tetratricopeptide (TPR) repeat protein
MVNMASTGSQDRIVRLLLGAAGALLERGETGRAGTLIEEALRLSQEEAQPALIAAARASQGVLARVQGDLPAADQHLHEALALRQGLSDPIGIARALGDLGRVHLDAGRAQEAAGCLDEAMGITAGLEPGRTRAEVLEHGGLVHARLGDPERAARCFEEALAVYERLGDAVAAARIRAASDGIGPGERTSVLDSELMSLERSRLVNALEAEGWNQSRAARKLGVTETRVRNLMRRHGLRPRNRRGRPRKTG